MSLCRDAFFSLAPDRRPIRLADGKLVYSEGVGIIHFQLTRGFIIIIDSILFVPSLSVSLFSPNRFARTHCTTHSEVTDYPICKWLNHSTGAVEFTATIGPDDLAYVDWCPVRSSESASVSMADLHARLNHLPFNSLQQLIHGKSVDSIPDHVSAPDGDAFCEDCINGKRTGCAGGRLRVGRACQLPINAIFAESIVNIPPGRFR